MKNISIVILVFLLGIFFRAISASAFPSDFPLTRAIAPTVASALPPKTQPSADADEWVTMPEGARPAYMGIHGGTMPVSLLVSADGASLFTFVGRTGNDFLEVLRNVYYPLPSIGNSTARVKEGNRNWQTGLFAGNATASMPVIALSGDRLATQAWFEQLLPFGLSSAPLSIEGEVMKPAVSSPARKYRMLFLPDYFQPKRGAN